MYNTVAIKKYFSCCMFVSEQVFTYSKTFSILSGPLRVDFNYFDFEVLLNSCIFMAR
jgi:hypothetical protein